MYTEEQKSRIKWACRRGMLELDVLIMPYFEECFEDLESSAQEDFVSLLECDDPNLFSWLMGHTRSENLKHAAIIDKIIAHNNKKIR